MAENISQLENQLYEATKEQVVRLKGLDAYTHIEHAFRNTEKRRSHLWRISLGSRKIATRLLKSTSFVEK